jgi:threonine/homoserine efflux transporter RhtA
LTVLTLGVAVGLLSSVIPYSFELMALRRIPARVFSILMSLEPAAAALAAMIVLGEFLTLTNGLPWRVSSPSASPQPVRQRPWTCRRLIRVAELG